MPIYEYRCGACGHDLEVLQKVNDTPLGRCPQCGKNRLRKQLTAAGFRLRGSGWYETDFKRQKPRKETDKESVVDKKKTEPKTGESPPSKGKSEAKAPDGKVSQAGTPGD